jgi:hypothetical protein
MIAFRKQILRMNLLLSQSQNLKFKKTQKTTLKSRPPRKKKLNLKRRRKETKLKKRKNL